MAMIVTDEMLADQRATIAAQIDDISAGIARLKKENAALTDLLREIREYLADQIDIVDGPEGQQLPNRAMRFCQEIDELVSP